MDGAAATVAEHLDFDVTWPGQVFLDVDCVVSECRLGFRARGRKRRRDILGRTRDLHTAPPAAGGGLDQDWKADVAGDGDGLGVARYAGLRARHHRNAEPPRRALGLDLVPHDA